MQWNVCLRVCESKRILGSWLPGLAAGKYRVTPPVKGFWGLSGRNTWLKPESNHKTEEKISNGPFVPFWGGVDLLMSLVNVLAVLGAILRSDIKQWFWHLMASGWEQQGMKEKNWTTAVAGSLFQSILKHQISAGSSLDLSLLLVSLPWFQWTPLL